MGELAPKPVKRSRLRRVMRVLGWTLLVLVVLVVVALGVFHSDYGQNAIRERIEGRLSERIDGDVTIESFSVSLSGEVTAGGVTLSPPDSKPLISLGRFSAKVQLGSLTSSPIIVESIALDALDLKVNQAADGTSDLTRMLAPSAGQTSERHIVVRRLSLSGASLLLTAPDRTVAVSDLIIQGNATIDLAKQTRQTELSRFAGNVTITTSTGTNVALSKLDGSLSVDATPNSRSISVGALTAGLSIKAPATDTRAAIDSTEALSVAGVQITTTDSSIDAVVDAVDAGILKLARIEVRFPPAPTAESPGRVSVEGMALNADRVNALVGRDVLLDNATLNVTASGPRSALVLDGALKTSGGFLTVAGTINVADPTDPYYDLTLVGKNVDTKALIPPIPGRTIPHVRTGLKVTVKGRGIRREDADLLVTLDLEPTQISGDFGPKKTPGTVNLSGMDVAAHLHDGIVELKTFELEVFGRTITATGDFDPSDGSLAAKIETRGDLDGTLKAMRALKLAPENVGLAGLDIDLALTVEGIGGAMPRIVSTASGILPKFLTMLKSPFDVATVKGSITARGLTTERLKADELTVTTDLHYDRGIPGGSVAVSGRGISARDRYLESARVKLELAALNATLTVNATEGAAGLTVGLVATAKVVPGADNIAVTIQSLDVKRGELSGTLLAPLAIVLPTKKLTGSKELLLNETKLLIAGSKLTISGRATVRPGEEEGSIALETAAITVVLDALDLGRVAKLAGRDLKGWGGTLSGTIDATGLPETPAAKLDLAARLRKRGVSGVLSATLAGSVTERNAGLSTTVHLETKGASTRVATVNASVPLYTTRIDGERFKRNVTIQRTAAWNIHVDIPPRRLATLAGFIPAAVRARLGSRDLRVGLEGDIRGSASRPTGNAAVSIDGRFLKAGRQKLEANALWVAGDTGSTVKGKLSVFNGVGPRALAHGTFDVDLPKRLTRSRPIKRWEAKLAIPTVELAALPLSKEIKSKLLGGRVNGTLSASGTLREASGLLKLNAVGLRTDKVDGLDAKTSITFTPHNIRFTVDGTLANTPLLTAQGNLKTGTRALMGKSSSRRRALMNAPLSAKLTVTRRSARDWATLVPKLAKWPGTIGLTVDVTGTPGKPVATVGGGWHDWKTVTGQTTDLLLGGRVTMADAELTARWKERASDPAITITAKAAPLGRTWLAHSGGAKATVHLVANAPSLRAVLPAALIKATLPDADGRVSADLTVGATVKNRAGQPIPSDITAKGHLTVDELMVAIPKSKRRVERGRLKLMVSDTLLDLDVRAFEANPLGKERSVALSVHAPVSLGLRPEVGHVTGTIRTDRWLAIGPTDAPQGEITLNANLSVQPKRGKAHIDIKTLNLSSAGRFMMRHGGEMTSKGDVIYVDEHPAAVGQLVGKAAAPTAPLPIQGWDILVSMPKDGATIHKSPLNLVVTGNIAIGLHEQMSIDGTLVGQKGHLEFIGALLPLRKGTIRITDDCLGCLDLTFAGRANHVIARQFAKESAEGREEIVIIRGTAKKIDLTHRGAGAGFLVNQMSTLNAGRPRRRGLPDRPASTTVQFPDENVGSMITTMLAINLPHLIIADTAEMWADPYDGLLSYGKVRHGLIDRYLGSDDRGAPTSRVVIRSRPRTAGRSDSEMGWEWVSLSDDEQSLFGVGVRVGTRGGGGPHMFWEWATQY